MPNIVYRGTIAVNKVKNEIVYTGRGNLRQVTTLILTVALRTIPLVLCLDKKITVTPVQRPPA